MSQGKRGNELRILGYNVRDLRNDQAAVVRVIRASSPDVLCLQELPRRQWLWWQIIAAKRLASRTDLRLVCGGAGSGGTAIMVGSDVEVISFGIQPLPVRPWWMRTRGWAWATVRTHDGSLVTVVSIHLSLLSEQRIGHIERLIQWARLSSAPVVVSADMNETPEGPSWVSLARALDDVQAGLAAPTFPMPHPTKRIDGFFTHPAITVQATAVGAKIRGVDHLDLCRGSDHAPILVEIVVPKGPSVKPPLTRQG
ncbi:MAG: endonuclease/exonuclease/phosphatase family protein [Actinomycetota bacterium]